MKPTLYEALGLSRTASDADIKAALRRLVRRYYMKTRAGHADVEEALRFLNHASHILGNPMRRAEYDANLVETTTRVSGSSMTTIGGTFQAELAVPGETELGESISMLGLPRDRPPPPPELAPELSAQLADIRRTPAGQLSALIVMAIVLGAAWIASVPKGGAASVIGFALSTLLMLGLAGVATVGIVHFLSGSIWQLPAPETPLTLVEGMIPRWRKDRTVFLGTGAPVEDATWLFRLRMAELKRVKAERVSDPHPGMRLLARLFDYSIWGLVYASIVGGLSMAGAIGATAADLAFHPLVAPIAVSASWIPIEALLLGQLQTTPGRWLLCVYLQQGVSNPYAPEELRFTFRAAIGRAVEVWWRGCAAWLPVVSFVTAARARELVKRSGETRWDSRRDCLVTHGPVGTLSLVTLALGILACALVYAAHWKEPVQGLTGRAARAMSGMLAKNEVTEPSAPIVSVPQSRISRLDDRTIAAPGAAPPTIDVQPIAPPAPAAPQQEPPLSPSVASNRAMAVENTQPSAITRSDEPAAPAAEAPPAGASGAGAGQPPPAAPAATTPPTASTPPAGTPPSTSSPAFSPKTFFSNLLKKPQPVEPPPAPTVEEPKGPTATELRERRVVEYMKQAQRQQLAGDHAGLIRTCTRWADDDWKNPRAYYCIGLGLQGTGQHKKAIEMFNKAGSLLPRDDPLKQQIGDAVLRSFRAGG